jgi:hypothetical protein
VSARLEFPVPTDAHAEPPRRCGPTSPARRSCSNIIGKAATGALTKSTLRRSPPSWATFDAITDQLFAPTTVVIRVQAIRI